MSAPNPRACPCCGLVQHVPPIPQGQRATCPRCEVVIARAGARQRNNRLAFSAALAGLLLFPVAVTLPIMTVERFGHVHAASIVAGGVDLFQSGEFLVGFVVLACSIVLPLAKLLGLLAITAGGRRMSRRRRASTYRWIERAGRWGMLDVLLIAFVIAWVKVGDLVEVTPGPAALAFTLCVFFSLLAGAAFDPHALWQREQTLARA